jgi:GntR family transcriptional regulator / MocR family aminotransferase
MAKQFRMDQPEVALLLSKIDIDSTVPIFKQMYMTLRQAILDKTLAPGSLLLPTRKLAEATGLSRTTVTQAYRQLQAEGMLESLVGSGTRVSTSLQVEPVQPPKEKATSPKIARQRSLSKRGQTFEQDRLEYEESHFHAEAFCPAAIDASHFPHELWGRSLARVWRKNWQDLMSYQGPEGYGPLREVVRDYLKERRQLVCGQDKLMVVAGAQQALDLCARVLTDPGDLVGLEEPGYLGARFAFKAAGAKMVPLSLDQHGLMIPHAVKGLRVIYCTPSHQFPTGVCMTAARRLELLEWAEKNDFWIVEDDYDSEFRYNSLPIPSLKSMDTKDRVIYIGSFSKLLHPSIRIGYVVLPDGLVTAFHGAKACSDRQTNLQLQAALVDFLQCEAFGRHLKRMRELYGERRQLLAETLNRKLGGWLELTCPDPAGLCLSAYLPAAMDDWQFHLKAREYDLELNSFSQYSLEKPVRGGIVFGFGGLQNQEIVSGVTRLQKMIEQTKV